jgi:hypothetical protein
VVVWWWGWRGVVVVVWCGVVVGRCGGGVVAVWCGGVAVVVVW